MPDDKADKVVKEILQHGAAIIDALDLTPVEREYAMEESWRVVNTLTEAYFDDVHLKGRKVRPVAVAAAVAFSLTYFDKWVNEMKRKFPDLGK